MLISAEIAESDPNFRNCPQYRKSQLFLNCLFADPSLLGGLKVLIMENQITMEWNLMVLLNSKYFL